MDSKLLAANAHKLLKEMGHDLPLGHVYELFSKLSGHKSWNVAKTKDGFEPVLKIVLKEAVQLSKESNYEVKITIDTGHDGVELKKYYKVQAESQEEAEKIISDYIRFREGDDDLIITEAVKILSELESEEDYLYKNWEIIWNKATPNVKEVVNLKSMDELIVGSFFGKITKEEFSKQLKAKMR